jgi:hypothetical protein
MQSWVKSEYRRGLSTPPCGAPVLRVTEVEMWVKVGNNKCITHSAINMLIEFRKPCSQIFFVRIPSYNKCSLRIYGL